MPTNLKKSAALLVPSSPCIQILQGRLPQLFLESMKNFGTVKCPPALSALTPKVICHQRPSGVPVKRRKVTFFVILVSNSGGKLLF
jgi:hypothetical protein